MRVTFPKRFSHRITTPALGFVLGAASAALAQQGASFEELAARAATARDHGNASQAIDLYSQATQLKPDWQEGWWYLTLLQYDQNLYGGAIDSATHLLQLAPQAVPAMSLRGLSEFEIGDYTGSLRDLDTAVKHGAAQDPRNEPIVRYHLALVLTRASRFQDALDQYKVFAQKGAAASPDMLVAVGLAGMRIPSLPGDIAPDSRQMIGEAGDALLAFLADRSIDADEKFRAAFAKYPSAPNLHLAYGFLLFSHDADLAAEQFKAEVAVAPQNTAARALLAYALVIAGRYAEALPEAEQVSAAASDMEMGQLALGRSLGETGQIDRGIDVLKKVIETDSDNLEAHIGLATLLGRAGKREEAYRERMLCLSLSK
jgi:tetratricopeptide (TPR) repeat protein